VSPAPLPDTPHDARFDGSSTEDTEFLRSRVAQFGFGATLFGGAFLLWGLVVILARPTGGDWSRVFAFNALGVTATAAMWTLCRRPERSMRFVRNTEAIGVITAGAAYAAIGAYTPAFVRPEMMVILLLTFVAVGRAIYVPSTAMRTFAISAVLGVPVVVGTYLVYSVGTLSAAPDLLPQFVAGLRPLIGEISHDEFALLAASEAATWWLATVVLATAASQVIYGLRREVHEARRLGQYVLEEKLGEGGMGIVYRASHAMLRRPTAVKLLPPERHSERDVARFEREVQLTARLSHPNTVTVFDYGRTVDGVFYYAMELLDGAPLDVIVGAAGPMPPERVAHVLFHVSDALAEAHGIGLIHRDLKPQNIILCTQGEIADIPKVLDFGLVKDLDDPGSSALTEAGTITGTPQYMAPETIRDARAAGPRSDIYALGLIGYYLLSGRPVFGGTSLIEVCGHHLHTEPEPPSKRLGRSLPQDLETLILECLRKPPEDRPASAVALRERVEACAAFGGWTRASATAWWERHGASVEARRRVGREGLTAWTALTTATRFPGIRVGG